MKQGAARHALKVRSKDLYETPPCAVRTLLRCERLPSLIWEPSAGRGAMVRELTAAGRRVIASDLVAYPGSDPGIETPVDFLRVERAPSRCRCIVTNPPFQIANDFIRHGLTLVPRVIVLLRLMAIEGASRSDLIDSHLRRVWAGIERLPFMHREGWSGPRQSNSGAPFAWFIFEQPPRHRSEPIALRRVSWRAA